ncbi:hypothetical protein [Xanthocytophaga flava]|uniref:hypothetical protein n=1 Tax=Xanthocytophaga flava TaxID=3048013 RepID=UPI0028D56AA7|nr:hypothetical protein [Xanthocytophaga flavus]MDJ1472441.1 hypothetical protein [Xanthocytophaga flavus]
MTDFFAKYDKSTSETTVEKILLDLCKSIDTRWAKYQITADLVTTTGNWEGKLTRAIHLSTPMGATYYIYRFIELEQPVDKEFPIQVRAFLNPAQDFGTADDPETLTSILVDIMGDPRTKIVESHLKQIPKDRDEDEGF